MTASAVLILLAAGCAGANPAAAPPAPPAAPPSTTTTPALPRADQATIDLALATTITQADLSGTWEVYTPAREAEPVTGCGDKSPLADLPAGARQLGPVLKVPNSTWFVYSSSAVFPDEAAAIKWAQLRNTPEYVECRRGELDSEQHAKDARYSVVTESTTAEGIGVGGYEGYTRYQLKADLGQGPQNASGTYDRHTYRSGRVMIGISIDFAAGEKDAPDLHTTIGNDLTRALAAVYGRVK
ncbi:hypothetical protein FKR81_01150 [Lentzea tibetensis]|uniref:PknH-like extracellular domain-containing protein n=1 Tax=Lentzea tibetensis TaxID=2591470 RepID=A0A563F361_9PSEU|nr:hypothetical protein [Lentzea tibetensis]TWP54198.1 hypothetical protein FKR81_01150 [Lentzea tibetensis]